MKEDFTLYPCCEEDDIDTEPASADLFQPLHWGNASSLLENKSRNEPHSNSARAQNKNDNSVQAATKAPRTDLPTPPESPHVANRGLPKAFKREIAKQNCKHRSSVGQL